MSIQGRFMVSLNLFTLSFPWDHKTPVGYAAVVIIDAVAAFIICQVIVCVMGILATYYLIGVAISQDFQRKLYSAVEHFKTYQDEAKLIQDTRDLYQFHIETKELSTLFNISDRI